MVPPLNIPPVDETPIFGRRRFSLAFAGLAFCCALPSRLFGQASLALSDGHRLQVEWEMPASRAPGIASELGVDRDHIMPAPDGPVVRGGPLLVIIVAAVLIVVLARAIVAAYRDWQY